jgi:rubredoxin
MIKMWRCVVCGYLHEGEEPPEFCPKCGAPREKFELLDEEEAGIMRDARGTREKYREILKRLDEIVALAEEGIALDLDEGCSGIFRKTVADTSGIRQMIKSELAGHAGECIWVKAAGDAELK